MKYLSLEFHYPNVLNIRLHGRAIYFNQCQYCIVNMNVKIKLLK